MTQRVQCPQCEVEVEVETIRLGIIDMVERCPACGEGPFPANLAEAMTAVLGDSVEVTVRAPQAAHIARALQDFHPEYGDTPIEELERMVETGGGAAGMTIAIPRLLAGTFADGVRSRYPLLTVECDAPLVSIAGDAENPMFFADGEDAAVNAAIATARERVGEFIARLQSPQPGDNNFAVKVPLPTADGGCEHIWLGDVRIDGDEFVGVVANEPQAVANLREGDEQRWPIEGISDWLYLNGDDMVGNFTLRAVERMLPPQSSADAAPAKPGLLRRVAGWLGFGAEPEPAQPSPRDIATDMLQSLQRAFPPEQTFALVAPHEIPAAAARALDEIAATFARSGLTPLCDFTIPSIRDGDGNLVPIRIAIAAGEGISCGAYLLPAIGHITFDVSSDLSDGRRLETTTAVGNKFDPPPEYHTVTLAVDTPFETVLATHRQRLAAIRRELPHIGISVPTTPEAVLDDARAASQRKHAYRREVGWLTPIEFRRMQPEDGDPDMMAAIYRELRDLATREAA